MQPPVTGPEVSVPPATLTVVVAPNNVVVMPEEIVFVKAPDWVSEVVSIGFPRHRVPGAVEGDGGESDAVRSLFVVRVARLTRVSGT